MTGEWPVATPSDPPRGHLPAELSSFIGRERELARILSVGADWRLLTLTGPGGVGKSRLAVRAARLLTTSGREEAWWIDIAEHHDPTVLAGVLAQAIGLRTWGATAEEALVEALRRRASLLVLDNCEHLLAACAELAARLLARCPGVRILATSRERLAIMGELVVRVPPLDLPQPGAGQAAAEASDAVRLFIERAQEVDPHFQLDATTLPATLAICHHLDGLPLAIELAAAWVGTLSVDQLARRVRDSLRLLVRGQRLAPQRQQTLRATLDWSLAELADGERWVLRRLAVFVGSWDLAAAAAVCGADLAPEHIAVVVSRLVDRSLIQAQESGGDLPMRYRLLNVVRQYARELLDAAGETEATQARHAAWYRGVAAAMQVQADTVGAVERLRAELGNLRAALAWAVARPDTQLAYELADRLHGVWYIQGTFSESLSWFERVLALPGPPPRLLVSVAIWACQHAICRGDLGRAERFWQRAQAAGEGRDEPAVQALILDGQAMLRLRRAELAAAAASLEQLRQRCADAAGFDWLLAATDYRLAAVRLEQASPREAERLCEEAIQHLGPHGNAWILMNTQLVRGRTALARGEPAAAEAQCAAALETARRLGDVHGIIESLIDTAWLAQARHQLSRSRAALHEALELAETGSEPLLLVWTAERLAALAARARPEAALVLARLAAAERAELGMPSWPSERVRLARALDAARRRLGSAARAAPSDVASEGSLLASLSAAGEGSLLASLYTAAQRLLDSLEAPLSGGSLHRQSDVLSPRELAVARLVAASLTNRAIAQELIISEGTVRAHIEHILRKLGVRSRHELATALATATPGVELRPAEGR